LLSEKDQIQEERKEYVKNIGIEYRFGCYEEKRADSCQLLGEYMEALEQNFKAAFTLFKQNCEERKYPKSCFKYGMYLLTGKDLTKMIEPMQIACDGNLKQGCRYLSLVHWNGEKHRPADSQKAEMYMKKACELEDGEACWLLSTWYMGNKEKFRTGPRGEKKEVERTSLGSLDRDMYKALEYGIKACELDIPQSCANVARMYKLGDGIEKNLDEAKKYVDRAKELVDAMKSTENVPGFTG
uniref:Sel1 repeat family protein n=1 Tax=Heligmosomoides polygyrus TaxID=6339 RepID=A0A8L8Q1U6_HELPZ